MTEEEEDKLLALKDFMMKSNKAKANIVDQSHLHDSSQKGVIDLAALGITGRQVDLVKTKQEPDDKRGIINQAVERLLSLDPVLLFWMFKGCVLYWKNQYSDLSFREDVSFKNASGKKRPKFALCEKCHHDFDIFEVPEVTNVQNRKPTIQVLSSTILPSTYQIRITTCKTELQQLIQQKREQCNAERIAKQMMENAEWESKPPPPGKCAVDR
ncbi:phosphoinositide 3-kinase regulatory subunit 4 isoform X2 [Pontoporia blainvillei]|uniref:Phosphoinositide 3-kinase regulatory subunit 4 isoform X2 n=1 Tax=Pontoporia blainvillei TaxID=48723 RepID=A0ABX0SCQ3_PONBL|nr:phosphoinositide 3-kinase regulatory subunit 4 isoform X2 [Pontoporia blainvillei]